MVDTTPPLPPLPPPTGAGDGAPPGSPWWRVPLLVGLVAVPIAIAAVGARLGCESGMIDAPFCGATAAPVAAATIELEISGGTSTVSVATSLVMAPSEFVITTR